MTRVALVANPSARSGTAGAGAPRVAAALAETGAAVVTITEDSGAATDAALRALVDADAVDRVVVVGGDGIVHLAVQVLAATPIPLGICPLGSGNDIAAALSIPTDIDAAVRCAMSPARHIDLLRIDDTWAASIATIGFAGDVNARANRLRWPRGSARYTVASFAELPGLKARPVTVTIDGVVVERTTTTLIAIANTDRFGGGMKIAPDARPDDGLADVTVVAGAGRLKLLRVFARVFRGTHTALDEITTHRGHRVELHCPGVQIWADGEPVGGPLGDAPAVIETVADALWVAAPPQGTAVIR